MLGRLLNSTKTVGSKNSNQRGAAGASTVTTSVNEGAQGVPATRTAAGAEGAFTTTTITLPKSGHPTTVSVSISAASAMIQVPTIGGYFVAGLVQAANPPLVLDVSALPESTSVAVQSQASAAAVLGFIANFE
jgi:pheromone shutdown protein TraB